MNYSGLLGSGGGLLGGMTVKIALGKVHLSFGQALVLGILCNILVCAAVWMAAGAKDITGKIFSCFFPIWLFITSGFEHSVANMYYVPAGILAKGNEAWLSAAGLDPAGIADLTWGRFFACNLLPVTIGNIIGGGVFIGLVYWVCYIRTR
jgi:formate/nitrite transporter